MASYEHFDLLLGEALECLNEAAGEIKVLSPSFEKNALKRIGRSICELWEARDDFYKIWPDLRRDFGSKNKSVPFKVPRWHLKDRNVELLVLGDDYGSQINYDAGCRLSEKGSNL
jgi:hypothetical protein